MPVKLVKLSNKEIIIGDVIFGDDTMIKIKNPLLIIFERYGNSEFYMGDYIPLCADDIIPISFKDILTVVNPMENLKNSWDGMINGTISIDKNIKLH